MQLVQMNLFPESEARLTGYLHDGADAHIARDVRPCVLIFPGGGYSILASHEAEPVAMRFYTAGYHAFVLHYSLHRGEPLGFLPLRDAAATMLLLRQRAAEWRIRPQQIAVCGFSAGGHLAASLGMLGDHTEFRRQYQLPVGETRPNAMILCYPVILADTPPGRSIANLVGDGDAALFSLERHVTTATPPVFLWHTADDASVPATHSLALIQALSRNQVPFESHIYASGPHGLSLATAETTREDPHVASWSDLCLSWLARQFRF